ncbi:MAG: ComEC/Rec2 family competence protein [Patescibacteria group bacterium]|nr:ComEC/Rec2 family competence protein [Patescibacteria group bacterium]
MRNSLTVIAHSKSKIFLICCFAFIVGIAAESIAQRNFEWWLPASAGAAAIFFLSVFWKNKRVRLICFSALFVILGAWRFSASLPDFRADKIQGHYDEYITWQGVVAAEPDARIDGIKYTVAAQRIISPEDRSVGGRVLVSAGLFPEFKYGDIIETACEIRKPEAIEDFRYDEYLGKDGIFALCYPRAEIKLVSSGSGNPVLSGLLFVKSKFAEMTNRIFSEPQASLLAGILYGARSGLPDDVKNNFQATGVSHIVAISGYNITIVASVLLAMAFGLGFSRRKAFPWIVGAIIIFVIFTGASASVVRAGIMGVLVLAAKQSGRASRIFNVLALTAGLMCAVNPRVLMFDAGFQLSFISTVGLVYLAPLLEPWFSRVPKILGLQESLTSTIAAIVATAPLIIFQFSRFSLIAPVANLLILPAVPITMALGFAAVLIGFVAPWIAVIFSTLPWLTLTYMLKAAEILASIPWAQVQVPAFHVIFLIAMYVWLLIWVYCGNKRL